MNVNHYIGFDVHKKSISFCVKLADGTIVEEVKLPAKLATLREWAGLLQFNLRGRLCLFAQMDVWSRDRVGPVFLGSYQTLRSDCRKAIGIHASEKISVTPTENLVFP